MIKQMLIDKAKELKLSRYPLFCSRYELEIIKDVLEKEIKSREKQVIDQENSDEGIVIHDILNNVTDFVQAIDSCTKAEKTSYDYVAKLCSEEIVYSYGDPF